MSMTTLVILSGAAGGATWAAITIALTWWFNRWVRHREGISSGTDQ